MNNRRVFSKLSLGSAFLALLPLCAVLAGCGAGVLNTGSIGMLAIQGNVHGGQQAVVGAQVLLYRVGTTGNGSAAVSLLNTPVYSGQYGAFNITNNYSCASTDDQLYIVAVGGNPGLPGNGNNPALAMMTALGRCGDLSASTFITINEVTTAAAAWALAPFMTSYANVGRSATNTLGMANAFLNARLLADPTTGLAPTLPANLATEKGKLYALADALASCVNTNGGAGCTPLFAAATPSGGAAPTDTLSAALNIVKHPATNVAAVFNSISAQPPFVTTLTAAPHDWTMSLTVSGGGLTSPASLNIETNGTVWVAGHGGRLSGFTAQGTPLSATGFGAGTLNESYGLTIDPSDNVWVTVEETGINNNNGSIAKFAGVSSGSAGTLLSNTYDASLNYPVALSADTNGNIFIANYANSSASVYNSSGQPVSTYLGYNNAVFPLAVAADANHGMWLGSFSDSTITHIAADGTILSRPACCSATQGLATDAFGNVWVANYIGSSVSEVADNGTVLVQRQQTGGLAGPVGVAIDANQDVWVANYHGATQTHGGSITHLAGSGGSVAAGTALAPDPGLGLDANLSLPYGIIPDRSGSVWVSNFAVNTVTMFFGLAAPTITPIKPVPVAP